MKTLSKNLLSKHQDFNLEPRVMLAAEDETGAGAAAQNSNNKNRQQPGRRAKQPQQQANGNKQQANGNKQQANGNKQQANGNKQQANGNKQQANGNKQQANGNKQQANRAQGDPTNNASRTQNSERRAANQPPQSFTLPVGHSGADVATFGAFKYIGGVISGDHNFLFVPTTRGVEDARSQSAFALMEKGEEIRAKASNSAYKRIFGADSDGGIRITKRESVEHAISVTSSLNQLVEGGFYYGTGDTLTRYNAGNPPKPFGGETTSLQQLNKKFQNDGIGELSDLPAKITLSRSEVKAFSDARSLAKKEQKETGFTFDLNGKPDERGIQVGTERSAPENRPANSPAGKPEIFGDSSIFIHVHSTATYTLNAAGTKYDTSLSFV